MIKSNTTLTYLSGESEKIPLEVFSSPDLGAKQIAFRISEIIRKKEEDGEYAILGLATGSSPIQVYRELVRMHKEEGLSFKHVITFNLDEYYPLSKFHVQSYHFFMHLHLFDHIDILPENIHIPDGEQAKEDLSAYCIKYDEKIDFYGGLDFQLLGIGRTGHIGFNEPGSLELSRTRLVKLDDLTRKDAQKDFGKEDVPFFAITMGVQTILRAKEIAIMAWGQHKAEVVQRAIEEEITELVTASFLQNHSNVLFYLDPESAASLSRFQNPWLVGLVNWDEELESKAVLWLAEKLQKSILKLSDEDYLHHGLSELIVKYSTSYDLNIKVFKKIQNTITGWPGGKPNEDDSKRPERSLPVKKRIIIFSPHPDDDVISMGGTFLRLVEQGHEVHVAYQVSGNIAVHDKDTMMYLDVISEMCRHFENQDAKLLQLIHHARTQINEKGFGQLDDEKVRDIKGIIRKVEAQTAAEFCGVKSENIHFLNLPFYESGTTKKKPMDKKDIAIVEDLINKIKPHQIFAAGDLADPNDTHRVCLEVIQQAFLSSKNQNWTNQCNFWLYRGAWHEFALHEIEMAVPLSRKELMKKRKAIFFHQSQKDTPVFPGNDAREFWQRAEDRNRHTAKQYNLIGLPEYEAIEAFRKWNYQEVVMSI